MKKIAEDVRRKYKRPVRVAVLDFVDPSGRRTAYGVTVGDIVLSVLAENTGLILLERSRLSQVLREHQLEHSGLFREAEFRRLGKLLSADVVVLGSYGPGPETNQTLVRGRFVDLGSAEIMGSFTLLLREPEPGRVEPGEDPAARCRTLEAPVLSALADLRDAERVGLLVSRATLVPFDLTCSRVHFRVMAVLESERLFPSNYTAFLSAALNEVQEPTQDQRVRPVLSYFAADGQLTEVEWAGVRALLQKAPYPSAVRRLLGILRRVDPLVGGRLDEVVNLAEQRNLGRPRTLAVEAVTVELLRLIHERNLGGGPTRLAFYERHRRHVAALAGVKEREAVTSYLRWGYRQSDTAPVRSRFLGYLALFYAARKSQESVGSELWSFLEEVHRRSGARSEKDPPGPGRVDASLEVSVALRDLLCPGLEVGSADVRASRAELGLTVGLRCPGFPDVRRYMNELGARDEETQLRAARMLSLLGPEARPAHDLAVRYLGMRGQSHRARALRRYSAQILGGIPTNEERAIRLLIETLRDFEGAHQEAAQALAQIGRPAVHQLVRTLQHPREERLHYPAVVVLGNMGKTAAPAVPVLEGFVRREPNSALGKQAAASIELIRSAP